MSSIERTQEWLSRFIVGWNLCPFAKKPFDAGLIRFAESQKTDRFDLLDELDIELRFLHETPRQTVETTLLIMPLASPEFSDFNDFLAEANSLLRDRKLIGEIQLVGFHPKFVFANTDANAVENYTNRSPYPMIHLLREISIEEVAKSQEAMDGIPRRNIALLGSIGLEKVSKEFDF
jgi:uncharacterized protein